ncbi:hypothetical protein SAMN05444166_4190 [Singulisphaera sp. GP187]|nr:hypothetical protein SAMN05444166_4190 [Singulisphaera sp. GP187]
MEDAGIPPGGRPQTRQPAKNEPCNRKACRAVPARYWNCSTEALYCGVCARKINMHSPGLCQLSDPLVGS